MLEPAEIELRYLIRERRRRQGRSAGVPDGMPRGNAPDDTHYIDALLLVKGIPESYLASFELRWYGSMGYGRQRKTVPLLDQFNGDLDAWLNAPEETRGGLCQIEEQIAIEPSDENIAEVLFPIMHERDPEGATVWVRKIRTVTLKIVGERLATRTAREREPLLVARRRRSRYANDDR